MTDLTKLTEMKPDILLSLVLRDDMGAWHEAIRRLKRLEQCEAALQTISKCGQCWVCAKAAHASLEGK